MENFSKEEVCPIRTILDRFGDKWSILVLLILGSKDKPMRFSQLGQEVGDISQKMLTVTLRTLEADGLITRRQYSEIPPRVEYALTELGESLIPHIDGLAQWAIKNRVTVEQTRERFQNKNAMVDF